MTPLRFVAGERAVFRKRESIKVSRWAARDVIVKDGPYAGGRIRLDKTPYLPEIMDTWDIPGVEEVDVAGGPQTGKTLALSTCLAYSVANTPCPRMLAMPDDETLNKAAEKKLLPLLRACAPVRKLLGKIKAGLINFLDSTYLVLSSAQSQAQRATISIRHLFMDEEDMYKSIKGQGDPVLDFIERTRSYAGQRKIMRISKPVGGEDSSILRAIKKADELRRYEARCPVCGHYQVMRKEQLVILEDCIDPAEVYRRKLGRYACERCFSHWTDHMRDTAVAAGRWRAERPVERPAVVAFHLPSILSSAVSISEVCKAKLLAEQEEDREKNAQAYANGYWAEAYTPVAVSMQADAVLDLKVPGLRPRTVPRSAVALTAGIDVQARGFWYVVRAWSLSLESWLVDYGFLATFEDVRALVFDTWWPVEATGEVRRIWRAGMDSGGTKLEAAELSRTEEVYQFVREHGGDVLSATKGRSKPSLRRVQPSVIDRFPSGQPIPGGLSLYMLDPFSLKEMVLKRLSPESSQPMHLHEETGRDYAEQVTAEEIVIENGRRVWKKTRRANHLLDCESIAAACADPEWSPGLQLVARMTQPRPQQERRPQPVSPASVGGKPSWFNSR